MAKGKKEPVVGTSHSRRTLRQQSHWIGTNLKLTEVGCGLIFAALTSSLSN